MKKCPYCDTEADLIASDWKAVVAAGICSAPTLHRIGGKTCLRKRLTRSEAKLSRQDEALREFRFQLSRDPCISDDTRITVIGHLDTALMEKEQ